MTAVKACTCCGKSYPETADYWHLQGDRKGYRAQCKQCANRKKRQRYQSKPRLSRARPTTPPPCVRVVEDEDGHRRALRYWEDGPAVGETWIGLGSALLELEG